MKISTIYDELIEDFVDHFLQLCFEIPEHLFNFESLREEFKCSVCISQYGEHPDFPSSPTLVNHEAPQIEEEDPNTPFVPFPTPFLVSIWVPHCGDCKADNSV